MFGLLSLIISNNNSRTCNLQNVTSGFAQNRIREMTPKDPMGHLLTYGGVVDHPFIPKHDFGEAKTILWSSGNKNISKSEAL